MNNYRYSFRVYKFRGFSFKKFGSTIEKIIKKKLVSIIKKKEFFHVSLRYTHFFKKSIMNLYTLKLKISFLYDSLNFEEKSNNVNIRISSYLA